MEPGDVGAAELALSNPGVLAALYVPVRTLDADGFGPVHLDHGHPGVAAIVPGRNREFHELQSSWARARYGRAQSPNFVQLNAVSFPHKIGHLPITVQIRAGFGFNHDSVGAAVPGGLQEYGGTVYTTIWNHLVGFNVSTPGIKLGDHFNPYKVYYFNASLDKQRQWFTVPHYQDVTAVNGSLSRSFSRKFSTYLAYTNTNVADLYIHGGYSPYVPSGPNSPFSNFSSFRGTATYRAYTLGLNYVPDPDLSFIVTAQQRRDFPIAVPGLFPLPPLNVLGQYTYTPFLGMPPYSITGEVRTRVAPHIFVDLQRTYYFNFGTLRWSPNFILQVTQ